MAVVLEALCGWFGFLGVGYLLRGHLITGIVLMLIWWATLAFFALLALFTLGFGATCLIPMWFVIPVLSALALLARSAGGAGQALLTLDQAPKRCPNCGHLSPRHRTSCERCGRSLP